LGADFVLIALLGVIYLNQTSRIATVGRQVQVLQYQLGDLKAGKPGTGAANCRGSIPDPLAK
jgi:hypothetical protein